MSRGITILLIIATDKKTGYQLPTKICPFWEDSNSCGHVQQLPGKLSCAKGNMQNYDDIINRHLAEGIEDKLTRLYQGYI